MRFCSEAQLDLDNVGLTAVPPRDLYDWDREMVNDFLFERITPSNIQYLLENDIRIKAAGYALDSVETTGYSKDQLTRMRTCYLACLLENVDWSTFFLNPDDSTFAQRETNIVNFSTRLAEAIIESDLRIPRIDKLRDDGKAWNRLLPKINTIEITNPLYPSVKQRLILKPDEVYRLLGFVREYLIEIRDAMQCEDEDIVSGTVDSPDAFANSVIVIASNLTGTLSALHKKNWGNEHYGIFVE